MSTWTNEKHEEARKALEEDMSQWGTEYGDDALDEIERMRALTTITDDKVDRAAREIYGPARWDSDIFFVRSPNSYWPHLAQGIYDARDKARATLEAALNPGKEA